MFVSRRVIVSLLLLLSCFAAGSNSTERNPKPGDEDWGYIEVRPGARMFYWLYYSTADPNPASLPLVMWLQGGPGASSTRFGNFEIIGPLDKEMNPRNSSWVHHVNVLFIDNPVGTGYSHVEDEKLLTKNNQEITADLITFTKSFYAKYPHFKKSPMAIFGESYGGKMNVEFALELDKIIKAGELDANLKAVAIGDGWVSPIDATLMYAPYLLHMGIVDMRGYNEIMHVVEKCRKAVEKNEWNAAFRYWWLSEIKVANATFGVDFYNILEKTKPFYYDDVEDRSLLHTDSPLDDLGLPLSLQKEFFSEENYRKEDVNDVITEKLATRVSDLAPYGKQSTQVFSALRSDFMRPVTHLVEELLNTTNIDVVVYNGHLDLIVSTIGQMKWVDRLKWPGKKQYVAAKRKPVVIDNHVEGYLKKHEHFSFWWINRAGHMVPKDNPEMGIRLLREVFGLPPVN